LRDQCPQVSKFGLSSDETFLDYGDVGPHIAKLPASPNSGNGAQRPFP
jgi:hypothetical protein